MRRSAPTPVSRRTIGGRLRRLVAAFRRRIDVYRRVLAHPRTPRSARWLLGAAIAYALSPVDLIPDWLPVIGLLDDLIIIPLLVWLALKATPPDILDECRRPAAASRDSA